MTEKKLAPIHPGEILLKELLEPSVQERTAANKAAACLQVCVQSAIDSKLGL